MHDGKINANSTEQIVHYARVLVEARAKRRAAKEANNQPAFEQAQRVEYVAGRDLDRAVNRNKPP